MAKPCAPTLSECTRSGFCLTATETVAIAAATRSPEYWLLEMAGSGGGVASIKKKRVGRWLV